MLLNVENQNEKNRTTNIGNIKKFTENEKINLFGAKYFKIIVYKESLKQSWKIHIVKKLNFKNIFAPKLLYLKNFVCSLILVKSHRKIFLPLVQSPNAHHSQK